MSDEALDAVPLGEGRELAQEPPTDPLPLARIDDLERDLGAVFGSSRSRTNLASPTTSPVTRSIALDRLAPAAADVGKRLDLGLGEPWLRAVEAEPARPFREALEDLEYRPPVAGAEALDPDEAAVATRLCEERRHDRRLARPTAASRWCAPASRGAVNRTSGLAEMLRLAEEPVGRVGEQALVLEPARDLARPLEEVAVRAQPHEAEIREPRLARAEQLAFAADLEIALGELEPVGRRHHRLEPLDRALGQLLPRPRDEQAVRLLGAPADAAAQLVELREPEAVGLLDDHDRRVRDVDADLDHGRRDEDVELPRLEARHHRAAVARAQAPVQAADAVAAAARAVRSRSASASAARATFVPDSSMSGQTTYACRPSSRWRRSRVYASELRSSVTQAVTIGFRSAGGDASSLTSRSPKTVSASVRGIGVAVRWRTCGLRPSTSALRCADAEAVLLVDDRDGEVVEVDLLLDQRVRPDDDVRVARGDQLPRGGVLARADRAREQRDADAERLAELVDREEVLLGERLRRRHQRPLAPGLDRAQERVQRDDRLPGADVALEQPLHRRRAREVGVDLGDRALLVGRERERERRAVAVDELARLGERLRRGLLARSARCGRGRAGARAARRRRAAAGLAPPRRASVAGAARRARRRAEEGASAWRSAAGSGSPASRTSSSACTRSSRSFFCETSSPAG